MKNFKNSVILAIALVLLFVAFLPFFHDTFFRVHDYTHVARITEMARTLQSGQFPALWSQNFGYGYGMPLFVFYGPLPFYLGALITFVGLSAVTAMKLLFILSGVLAFSGMYLLMKPWGRTVALLSATVFLWAPYRAVDIYVRGALSEVTAMSILPWILLFSFLIPRKRTAAWIGLSISLAAVVLTHNLTALIAIPFLLGISVIFLMLEQKNTIKNLITLSAGYGMGLVLSAFYTVPLFLEKSLTIVDEITNGYFDFRLHFLYIRQFFTADWGYGGSSFGREDGMSFHLGRIALILAVLALGSACVKIFRSKLQLRSASFQELFFAHKKSILVVVLASALGGSLFLTLTKSQFLWESIPFLAYLQFPWRFLTVAHLFLAMLAGLSIHFIRSFFWRWLTLAVMIFLIVWSQFSYHQPESYLQDDQEYYYVDEQRIQTDASDVLFDYLPKTFNRELTPITKNDRISVLQSATYLEGTWKTNQPGELLYEVSATPGAKIQWKIADYPGWEYRVNGKRVEVTINQDGLAEFEVQGPLTTIGASFVPTPLRRLSTAISLIGALAWLAVAVNEFRKNKGKNV